MKPTVHRIQWTTMALNFFMALQHFLELMRVKKADVTKAYVKGTQKDADFLTALITEKMGETPDALDVDHPFNVEFWYPDDFPEGMANIPPSNGLEAAFQEVHVWHNRHKKVWDLTITEEEFLQEVDEDGNNINDNDDDHDLD